MAIGLVAVVLVAVAVVVVLVAVARSVLLSAAPEPLPESTTAPLLPAGTEVVRTFADEYSPEDGPRTYLVVEDVAPGSGAFPERWRQHLTGRGAEVEDGFGSLALATVGDLSLRLDDHTSFCDGNRGLCGAVADADARDRFVVMVRDTTPDP